MERFGRRTRWISVSAVALVAVLVLWNVGLRDRGSEEHSAETNDSGHAIARSGDFSTARIEPSASANTATARKEWVVTGVVADPAGFPVSGAAIDVWSPNDNETEPQCRGHDAVLQAQANSNSQGTFELSLPEEELYCVRARHASWSGSEPALVSTGERRTESIRLVLEQSERVNGRVVDTTNGAVANVGIELVRQDGPAVGEPKRATTDGNGRFSFRGVDSGDYSLRSTNGRYVISKPRTIAVRSNQPLDDLLVQIDAMVAIHGRVVNATGTPLPNVRIVARSPYDPELFLGSTTSSDTGAFVLLSEQRSSAARMAQRMAGGIAVDKSGTEVRVPLGAEGVCVEFDHPDLRADALNVVANGTALDIGTVHLRSSRSISGRVLDNADRPLAAKIVFREVSHATGREAACSALPVVREARSSANGAVNVQLKPGRYEVHVYANSSSATAIDVTVGPEDESLILKVE
jgi:hypothetical protein